MSNQTDLIQQTVHTAVGETPEYTVENRVRVWDSAKETAETEGMDYMARVRFYQECIEYFASITTK